MSLQIETLEAFFGSRLQFPDQSISQVKSLACFDGFFHWCVLWDEEREFLKTTVDREPGLSPLPTVEVDGFYSSLSVTPLTGGCVALVLKPVRTPEPMNYLVIAKATDGRFSMSTTCGNPPLSLA